MEILMKVDIDLTIAKKYNQLRMSAEQRNLEFKLTPYNVKMLLEETHCQYTGTEFARGDPMTHRSIERVDNNKGYVPGNVIPVTMFANKLRSDHEIDRLEEILKSWENSSDVEHNVKAEERAIENLRKKTVQRENQIKELQKNIDKDNERIADHTKTMESIVRNNEYKIKKIEATRNIIGVLSTNAPFLAKKYLTWIQKVKLFFGLL
jgi:hypothetical protein